MDKQQLMDVMRFHLDNFSDNDDSVTNDTKHSKVLFADDGIGTANSKRIYRSVIRWTLIRAGIKDKPWPDNWIDLTVDELSTKLI